jgi:hypothetical protein
VRRVEILFLDVSVVAERQTEYVFAECLLYGSEKGSDIVNLFPAVCTLQLVMHVWVLMLTLLST